MQPPKWAHDLMAQVCKSHGKRQPTLVWKKNMRQVHNRRTNYTWQRKHSAWSSGYMQWRWGDPYVVVRAGLSRPNAEKVLLHELAHYLTPRRQHHSLRFWRKAWSLYAKYGVDLMEAKLCEFEYKDKARRSYYRVRPYQKRQARG